MFLCILLGSLDASELGSMLTEKSVMKAGKSVVSAGKGVVRAAKGVVRVGREFNNMGHLDKIFLFAPAFNQY